MTVTITPGHRDEELITKIKEARQSMTKDEWENCCFDAYLRHDEKWFDALYYAMESEQQEEILAYWEDFMYERLTHGYGSLFLSDMAGLRKKENRRDY